MQEDADGAADLDALEAQLPVNDILLFRLLAEHSMPPAEQQPAAQRPVEEGQAAELPDAPDAGQKPAADSAR